MYGAILGDIIGSKYELNNIKTKDFPLFSPECCFTDDSILTAAAADWVLHGGTPEEKLVLWGKKYQNRHVFGQTAFSKGFMHWLNDDNRQPYGAKTNGCLMRVSPIPFIIRNPDLALKKSLEFTNVTHNHPESIQAVTAYVKLIHASLSGCNSDELIKIGATFGYDFTTSVDEEREKMNSFKFSCKKTFAPAMICAIQADSYEDAVRNAVSLGGDSDTLACITGAIAEARFGIPNNIAQKGLGFLDGNLKFVLRKMYQYTENNCKIDIYPKGFER